MVLYGIRLFHEIYYTYYNFILFRVEHLYPESLNMLPYNIFGFIRPKVAIITTPNADFNVLFKNISKFRHADHKFEWTRQQFQDW
jgi:hypothetical protein